MHRVVPELIVEKYRRGEFTGEFQAVGLFLDLSGFSSMTDELMQHGQHGAEVLANLMHGVFDPLVENIFNHGGRIVSFAGDGIMALFPSSGDDKSVALHALTAAWIIQRKLLENPERQTVYGNFHFSVKIGIAFGSVSWGILRSVDGGIATYYFRGSAVDDSARAEHTAYAGYIVLTENIYTLLQDEIQVAPHASFHHLVGFNIELPDSAPIDFPPIDLTVSKLFMPEEVITQDIRGEFRQIVNLFLRLPDLDHNEVQELARVVFELHDKYGGLINRLDFGDKGCNLLLLWGAPTTYENDIGRALNFVLELKARVKFPITAGVTYYVAHAGYLGSTLCEDYTCYGWGVNLASRFMMTAPQGGVWIDERIARRVKNRFEFEYQGAQQFKGFAAEQKVFALSARKAQEILFQGEFVGREVELPRLVDYVQPLWRGKFAGLVTIWGDAGIGKSRLVYELKASLPHQDRNILWGLCHSDQILRNSFNPFRYWLLRYFEIDSNMGDATQKQAFDSKLDQLIQQTQDLELAGELDRIRSVLGSLLDLHWPDSFYDQLDAEGRYNNTLNALIDLVKAESLRQPAILFIEDAQFLDEDTTAFLPRLKSALTAGQADYPVAILLSSRYVGAEAFLTNELVDQAIDLGPLSLQALFDLAEIYLGGKPSPELVHLIQERSEGNPYFAEQILIYLQEENLLELSPKGWRAIRRWQDSSLPADIRALLIARLDQLTRNVRDVIQMASILGREFDTKILVEMVKDDDALASNLLEGERANIWSAISRHRYAFTHGLLRDAAYSMQMRAHRIDLHFVALKALEKVYGEEEVEHHYGELAYHAERGRLSEKALHYLQLAGKAAANSYQNSQAIDYFTRALAFVRPTELGTQFDILVERVDLFSRMGKRELQLKDLNSLEQWAEDLGDDARTAKALMLKASYYFATGNYLNSIECAKEAEIYSASIASSELVLYTQVVWVMALLRLGRAEEAMQHAQETLKHDQIEGNRKEECRILNAMGLIALEQEEMTSAHDYLVKALEIAREIQDPGLESRSLNNLAKAVETINRNYAVSREYYEQSYIIAHKIGDRTAEGFALANMGFAAGIQGDFIAARSYHEQSLFVAREIGNHSHEAYTLINLSAVAGLQDDAKAALLYAQQAEELSRKISERVIEAWAMLYMGHAYLLQNEFQLAKESYRRSIEIRNELGQPALSMEAIAGLVEVHLMLDDVETASQEAEKILTFFEAGSVLDGTDEPLRVYYACYLLLEKKQDLRSRRILKDAMQLLEAQVSNFSDDNARRRYIENIPWRRALWNAAQARQN